MRGVFSCIHSCQVTVFRLQPRQHDSTDVVRACSCTLYHLAWQLGFCVRNPKHLKSLPADVTIHEDARTHTSSASDAAGGRALSSRRTLLPSRQLPQPQTGLVGATARHHASPLSLLSSSYMLSAICHTCRPNKTQRHSQGHFSGWCLTSQQHTICRVRPSWLAIWQKRTASKLHKQHPTARQQWPTKLNTPPKPPSLAHLQDVVLCHACDDPVVVGVPAEV